MSALWSLTATQLLAGYRSRQFSPVEVVRSVVDRIEHFDRRFNAFCVFDPEAALTAARESERCWRANAPRGLLEGVPISVKDLIHVRGWPTRHGSKATPADGPWDFDSPSVAHVRQAGAILLGKTTTPEFGHKGVTESPLTGRTSNPWNVAMNPGGSSGGAGAALAAGMGPLALGTDGGGSCRKPASYCGVVGMKPSHGLVPAWPPSALWPLSTSGPMARSADDCALLLEVIARPDLRDPMTDGRTERFADMVEHSVRDLRIGFTTSLGGSRARPEVAAVVRQAAERFRQLGAEVMDDDPEIPDPLPTYRTLLDSGWLNIVRGMSEAQQAEFDPTFSDALARAAKITANDLRQALDDRLRLAARLAAYHARYDLLLCPTNPVTAYPHGTREPVPEPGDWFSATVCFTFPFNITGQPAISVPCGESAAGLPIGLQIVGPSRADHRVLRAAQAFELVSGWKGRLAPLGP
ncbi:MAG: amidase [Alphaproteobacteria bacterium]|nr:amidase [Alphaproteobacteria bacterium]